MCELCLDSREGAPARGPEHAMLRSPRRGEGKAFKRTKASPRRRGRGERRTRRVYGSQNQHMHASPVSEQVTPSSSYLSFLSMQQHPTQPTIEASQKMIARRSPRPYAKGSLYRRYICIHMYTSLPAEMKSPVENRLLGPKKEPSHH